MVHFKQYIIRWKALCFSNLLWVADYGLGSVSRVCGNTASRHRNRTKPALGFARCTIPNNSFTTASACAVRTRLGRINRRTNSSIFRHTQSLPQGEGWKSRRRLPTFGQSHEGKTSKCRDINREANAHRKRKHQKPKRRKALRFSSLQIDRTFRVTGFFL